MQQIQIHKTANKAQKYNKNLNIFKGYQATTSTGASRYIPQLQLKRIARNDKSKNVRKTLNILTN
jgi:hypothetical protein